MKIREEIVDYMVTGGWTLRESVENNDMFYKKIGTAGIWWCTYEEAINYFNKSKEFEDKQTKALFGYKYD